MKNKIFEINVDFETKSAVDTDLIKIVKGDYNSIEFDLKMDKTDYKRAVLFLVKPSKKNFVVDIANSKAIFTEKNTFDEVGIYYYGIVLYGTNSKLTTSTKGKIQVVEGYNEDNEDITGDDNYPILDKLIEEVTDLKDKINASLGVMNKTFKEVTYDPSTGVMSFKNLNNEVTNINLPLSLLISSASYDNDNKKIVLTLANNDTIDIPILDLVSNYYDDKINANKEYIASTSNELYRLKTDVLETGESSGNNIHLEDSAWSEMQELSVDGVCEQETTQGKQLFNYEDTTMVTDGITVDEDGWITATFDNTNGTGYKYFNFYTNNLNLKNSTTYAIVSEIKSVSGTGFFIPVSKTNATPQTGGQFNSEVSYNFATLTNNMIKIETPTTIDDFSTTNYGLRTLLQFAKGQSGSITFRLSVLEDTSVTADTFVYEKFTGGQPSPSPDYPQEIKTIENSLKITSCNKNLFGTEWEKYGRNNTDGTSTVYSDKYIRTKNPILVKPNNVYSFKVETEKFINGADIHYYDINKNFIGRGSIDTIFTKTIPNNCHYINIQLYCNTGIIPSDINTTQLEKGSTPTPYEQHLETQIEANLPEGEFIGKINDTYKDTLNVVYKDDGHYHLILNKMIGKIVLNGSETFYINAYAQTLGYNIFVYKGLTNSLANGDNSCKSNYFIHYSWGQFDSKDAIYQNSNWIMFKCGSLNIGNDIDKFKEWLSTHNTEVYYALATPYVIELGIVDTLLSYDEITNIFTDSDLYPVINVKYYRNFIKTIQNLQVNNDTLKNELSNIESRLSALENANTNVVDNNPTDESEVTE